MACNNAVMVRFVPVVESISCAPAGATGNAQVDQAIVTINNFMAGPKVGGGVVLSSITQVDGLNLGEEGTVEVPYWDRKVELPDGVRKMVNLSIGKRIMGALSGSNDPELNFLAAWFVARGHINLNWRIHITDRGWGIIMTYRYINTALRSWKQDKQELGQAKLGEIMCDISTNDIELWDCANNPIVVSAGASTFTGACAA